MTPKVRRRLFVTTLVGASVAGVGIGMAILPLAPEQRLKKMLRSRLHYLPITDGMLDRFTKDYLADPEHRFDHFRSMMYVAQRAVYGVEVFNERLPIFRFERHLVSSFLLSTNFFRDGADPSKPLTYVAYNDPYKVGCANPFVRL